MTGFRVQSLTGFTGLGSLGFSFWILCFGFLGFRGCYGLKLLGFMFEVSGFEVWYCHYPVTVGISLSLYIYIYLFSLSHTVHKALNMAVSIDCSLVCLGFCRARAANFGFFLKGILR